MVTIALREQMVLKSGYERLQVPDVLRKPVSSQWCRHGEGTSSKVCCSREDDEVTVRGRSQSASLLPLTAETG